MTDRDARAYRLPIGALSTEGVFRLDAEGRVVRSPSIEKLIIAARVAEQTLQVVEGAADTALGRRVSHTASAMLRDALGEVDTEARALELGTPPIAPAPLGECHWCIAIMAHDPTRHFRGCPLREEKAQPLANKELPPNVDHGLETPKPGGEPGSDVVSELLAPDPSVTSGVEK